MRNPVLILTMSTALLACEGRDDRLPFDGQYYRAKASKVDGDLEQFQVTVQPVSTSFEGALEAGRYQATRYCVLTFGNSAIDWVIGPDQDPESYAIINDTLVLRGACEG